MWLRRRLQLMAVTWPVTSQQQLDAAGHVRDERRNSPFLVHTDAASVILGQRLRNNNTIHFRMITTKTIVIYDRLCDTVRVVLLAGGRISYIYSGRTQFE